MQYNNNWSKGCTKALINAILEKVKVNPKCFEKPDAKSFYNSLKKEHIILQPFAWKMIRDKVCSLREKYMEAIKWRYDNGANINSEETIDEMNKICPFFKEIDEILSNKINMKNIVTTNNNDEYIEQLSEDIAGVSHMDYLPFDFDKVYFTNYPKFVYKTNKKHPKTTKHDQYVNNTLKEKQSNHRKEKFEQKKNTKNDTSKFKGNIDLRMLELEEKKIVLEVRKLEIEKEKINLDIELRHKQMINLLFIEKYKIDKEIELKRYELDLKYQADLNA